MKFQKKFNIFNILYLLKKGTYLDETTYFFNMHNFSKMIRIQMYGIINWLASPDPDKDPLLRITD